MKTRLINLWEKLTSSYWFMPALLAWSAIVLSFVARFADQILPVPGLPGAGWLYPDEPEAARILLSTVAGAMITVAGVVFSVTVVALSLASQQFGPRLLRNFMRDRGNQFVLGIFIATYLYCLVILQSIHVGPEPVPVPHFSLFIGFALALLSLGVLIYFIHHVSESIQVASVIHEVSRDLTAQIRHAYPPAVEDESRDEEDTACRAPREMASVATAVTAAGTGYVQALDEGAVLRLAEHRELLIVLRRRPGHFVNHGSHLGYAWPPDRVDEGVVDAVRDSFIVGHRRSRQQDIEVQIHELAELAVRALSPGVNDPFTAMSCVDHLGACLAELAQRRLPPPCRRDSAGTPRLFLQPITFSAMVDEAFNQIRQYGRTSAAVTIRLLETITVVSSFTRSEPQRAALRRQAAMIERGSHAGLPEQEDRADVAERYQAALQALDRAASQKPADGS